MGLPGAYRIKIDFRSERKIVSKNKGFFIKHSKGEEAMKRLFFCLLVCLLGFSIAYAEDFYVSSPEEFQTALNQAGNSTGVHVIHMAPGTYYLSRTLTLNITRGTDSVPANITIVAQDPSNPPVLDGNNTVRIMNIYAKDQNTTVNLTIDGIIFKNGYCTEHFDDSLYTHGLYVYMYCKGTLTIRNCSFIKNGYYLIQNNLPNVNTHGGAIAIYLNRGIRGIITENYFEQNVGRYGGAVHYNVEYPSEINITENTFTNNFAQIGAGIDGGVNGASAVIENNVFSENHAESGGGGAFLGVYSYREFLTWEWHHGTVLVKNNLFVDNNASSEGGLYLGLNDWASRGSIVGNSFFNNTAQYNGGGVYVKAGGPATLINNIIYNNSAQKGGGIYADVYATFDQPANPLGHLKLINNTIFGNNVSDNGAGLFLKLGSNCDVGTITAKIYNNIIRANHSLASNPVGEDVYIDQRGSHCHDLSVFTNDLGENSDLESGNSEDFYIGWEYSGNYTYDHGNNIFTDPFLANPEDGDFHLSSESPCIDAGDNDILPRYPDTDELVYDTDFEGDPRIINESVDIGADEANNEITQHMLNVFIDGAGSVYSSPEGIDCGEDCSKTYEAGTEVTLTAEPAEGYMFTGWTGDCEGCEGSECTILMDSDKTCGAEFQEIPNEPPVIDSFTADPTSGDAPLTVTFTCTAHDPDGAISEYCFDFDGDGAYDQCDDSTNAATYTYEAPGTYHPTCKVVDDDGAEVVSESVTVTVNEAAPAWVDITDALSITHSPRQLYDRIHRAFFILVTIENLGDALSGPVRMVITDPSIPVKTGVGVGLEPDGYTDDGDPYFIIVPEDGTLDAGEILRNLRINFELQRKRLTYGITIEQLQEVEPH